MCAKLYDSHMWIEKQTKNSLVISTFNQEIYDAMKVTFNHKSTFNIKIPTGKQFDIVESKTLIIEQ